MLILYEFIIDILNIYIIFSKIVIYLYDLKFKI